MGWAGAYPGLSLLLGVATGPAGWRTSVYELIVFDLKEEGS